MPDSQQSLAQVRSPFAVRMSERSANALLVEWINRLIEDENLPIGRAKQEVLLYDKTSPDVLIPQSKTSPDVLLLIELKPPYWDIHNNKLVDDAFLKAGKVAAKYFATWNVNRLALFDARAVDRPYVERIVNVYDHVASIEVLDDLERAEVEVQVKAFLRQLLTELVEIEIGRKPRPKVNVDQIFISRLHSCVSALTRSYSRLISKQAAQDLDFLERLKKWFVEQNWAFSHSPDDYDKVARQAAYLLVNKILFYAALQSKFNLDPLEIPANLTRGDKLQKILQLYFDDVLAIDYETIFTTDFIDDIAFPQDYQAIEIVRSLVNDVHRYKIAEIGYEILGNIFEGLIPVDEQRKLGQYFTRADVVDLILKFCLRGVGDYVLDPGCGAGTFLKRAYRHKRIMDSRLKHEDILITLWGVDIAKFAAHLTTINLAINDLGSDENYPRIVHNDFFAEEPTAIAFSVPKRRIANVSGVCGKDREVDHPGHFDCVVGNPPYTRQEWMEDLVGDEGYKKSLIERATTDQNGKRIATISKRAGIHVYFFVHGTKFLSDGGRFGFIVSNSWLDVGYGKGLQEFFLKNYKILAIIESKVERWFVEADINTCIVILEKCADEEERDENIVRFVQLKRRLEDLVPRAGKSLQEDAERLHEVDLLIQHVMTKYEFYRNEDLRIYPIKQAALWEEGYDRETDRYEGAKWGKYLRAPDIFFDILERNRDKLVRLSDIAEVRFGIKTGANAFFYLDEEAIKRWEIEEEYLKPVLKSPRECKSILVKPEDLGLKVLMVHKDKEDLAGTNVLKYIEFGEGEGYHLRPTCASRPRWYDLGPREPGNVLWPMIHYQRHLAPFNLHSFQVDHNLFEILPKSERIRVKTLCALLNSTFSNLIRAFVGRTTLGQGALKTEGIDIAKIAVLDPRQLSKEQSDALESALDAVAERPIESIFEEVKREDRRRLDDVVFDILGLLEEEREAIYEAVVDLVRARIQRAESVAKQKKRKESVDVGWVTDLVLQGARMAELAQLYQEALAQETRVLPIGRLDSEPFVEQELWGYWVRTKGRDVLKCDAEEEARYVAALAKVGLEEIRMPTDPAYVAAIVDQVEAIVEEVQKRLDFYLETIPDRKICRRITRKVWSAVAARVKGEQAW
jgi:type I restriction enzyme M protein